MALTRPQKIEIEQQLRRLGRARNLDAAMRDTICRALEFLHDEDYGHCLECGADISFERLREQPTALRCARCQNLAARNSARPQPDLTA